MSLDVLVLSYNFEQQIVNSLLSVKKACENWGGEYRIILFDDCSTDKTLELAKSLAMNNLFVVSSEKNLGAGFSLLEGLKLVQADYCSVLDGDDMVYVDRFKYHFDKILKLDANIGYYTAHDVMVSTPSVISPEYILKNGLPAQYGGLTFPRSAIKELINIPPLPLFDFVLVYFISKRCVIYFDSTILVSYLPGNGVTRHGYNKDWFYKMYANLRQLIMDDPYTKSVIIKSLLIKTVKLIFFIPLSQSFMRLKLILKVCII
jgi:glycosyltransferase involved in cell wall biosynthesis